MPRGRGDKMGVTFGRPPPKIWEGEKNFQKSARFLTTFEFDREYLWNVSTQCKSENNLINYIPYYVWWIKFSKHWFTNKKVLGAHIDQHKWTFFGRLHFGKQRQLGGCPSDFTLVRDWPIDYLEAPTPQRGRCPPPKKKTKNNCKIFKFGFQVVIF